LRRILIEEWDPIGVQDVPEAQDEYDNYLGPIARRLQEGAASGDIAAYLTRIEEDFMGLEPLPAAHERSQAVAARLVAWYAAEIAIEGR
jgi:hypothetical protein